MAATLLGCSNATALAQTNVGLPALPQWDHLVVVQAGAGYNDNTTLSHFAPEASPLLKAGAEVMVFNLAPDGPQFNLFLSGDHQQYFFSPSVDHEQLVFGQAMLEVPVAGHGEVSLATEYLYQNQVLDVSLTETNREALPVRGHTFTARPGFRWTLPQHFWIGVETPFSRQLLKAPLDNYWEAGPRIELGREYGQGRKSRLSLSYQAEGRAYDQQSALAADGVPLTGSHRRFLRHETEVNWRHYWDARRRWRTVTRAGFRANQDNGGGYFDYQGWAGSEEIRFRNPTWELVGRARLAYYQYPVQTVSPTDLRRRERTELALGVHGERRLTTAVKLVADYAWERTWSNQQLEAYTLNTVTAGVHWEF